MGAVFFENIFDFLVFKFFYVNYSPEFSFLPIRVLKWHTLPSKIESPSFLGITTVYT